MNPNKPPAPECWRVRMNYPGIASSSKAAWSRNEVGVWYGAWTVHELRDAQLTKDPRKYLEGLPNQAALGWEGGRFPKTFVDIISRFDAIPVRDWVLAVFDEAIHLARVAGPLGSSGSHPLNRNGELFHYRPISGAKSFPLGELPDSFRLLQTDGRQQTVHQFRKSRRLAQLLVESTDASEVRTKVREMPLETWLNTMGPEGWESLCLGYLILSEQFVPTGLSTGRTLKGVDMIGKSRADGVRVVAQCKKDPDPTAMDTGFREVCRGLPAPSRAYYFAFAGCVGPTEPGVRVVSWKELELQLERDLELQRFVELFRG